jgi:aspartate aminotransferase-like enzyme
MIDAQTAPNLQNVITTWLKQWSGNLPMTPSPTAMANLQEALQTQDAIGWDIF